jgi:hypothetical protein
MRRFLDSRLPALAPLALATVTLFACGGSPPPSQSAANAPGDTGAATQAPAEAPPSTAPAVRPSAPAPEPSRPAPRRAPQPAPQPAPPPPPAPIVKTIAPGTQIDVELVDAASSKTSQVGQAVHAKVTHDVSVDGVTVIPAGTIVNGVVTEAIPLKKIGGAASLGLKFSTLEVGSPVAIDTSIQIKGKSESGKDAGTIAGATAGGALLGRVLAGKNDKTKGTLIGAVVGAAAGTGVAAATKGQEVELPVGTPLTLKLESPADVTVQP